MTDQTKPMDAERLAEIRRKIDQWCRGTYDATEDEFDRVIFMDVPDLLAEVERLNAERDALVDEVVTMKGNPDSLLSVTEFRQTWAAISSEFPGDESEEAAARELEGLVLGMTSAIAKSRNELSRLRAVIKEARARTFNLYRDGILRENLGQNGEPLAEIHNLLANALDRGLKGAGDGSVH